MVLSYIKRIKKCLNSDFFDCFDFMIKTKKSYNHINQTNQGSDNGIIPHKKIIQSHKSGKSWFRQW
jgi:hypothetical protein